MVHVIDKLMLYAFESGSLTWYVIQSLERRENCMLT